MAVRSAPAARSASTPAVEHRTFNTAKWKAALPSCEGARKGTRHGRCSEHETRAPHHRKARPGITSVSSGRGTQQQGLCYKLLCPVLKQPDREQVVWACCRSSTPWCSNALKLCKQHRTGEPSRSLKSPPGRSGSLFKFRVILCDFESAGLVRAARACRCTFHDRPSCSAEPLPPLSFLPSH